MSFTFPSAEWATDYKRKLDENPAYREAAAAWTFGPIALVIKGDAAIGLAEDVGLFLDIDRGVCRDIKVVSRSDADKAPFCIAGEYSRWKSVIRKELDPIKAMMQKKLELKGQMTTIVKYVNASRELVESATRVPTQFLDEK